MKRKNSEDLDRILNELEVGHVPAEFIKSARIVYNKGESIQVSPEELDDIMNDDATLAELGIQDIGLVLDLDVIKLTVREYSEVILQGITK